MTSEVSGCEATGGSLERVLFAMAGTVALVGGALALAISPWFALLPILAGVNQWLYVLVGACPASMVLTRVTNLKPSTGAGR